MLVIWKSRDRTWSPQGIAKCPVRIAESGATRGACGFGAQGEVCGVVGRWFGASLRSIGDGAFEFRKRCEFMWRHGVGVVVADPCGDVVCEWLVDDVGEGFEPCADGWVQGGCVVEPVIGDENDGADVSKARRLLGIRGHVEASSRVDGDDGLIGSAKFHLGFGEHDQSEQRVARVGSVDGHGWVCETKQHGHFHVGGNIVALGDLDEIWNRQVGCEPEERGSADFGGWGSGICECVETLCGWSVRGDRGERDFKEGWIVVSCREEIFEPFGSFGERDGGGLSLSGVSGAEHCGDSTVIFMVTDGHEQAECDGSELFLWCGAERCGDAGEIDGVGKEALAYEGECEQGCGAARGLAGFEPAECCGDSGDGGPSCGRGEECGGCAGVGLAVECVNDGRPCIRWSELIEECGGAFSPAWIAVTEKFDGGG